MNKSNKHHITSYEFNPNFLKFSDKIKKECIEKDTHKEIYYEIPILYNMGTEEHVCFRDLIIEGIEMFSKIYTKTIVNGNTAPKVINGFIGQMPLNNEFTDVCDRINNRIAELFSIIAKDVGKTGYTKEIGEAIIKKITHKKYDGVIGEIIGPYSYFDAVLAKEKCVLMDSNGKLIPWDLLENMAINYIPLYKISGLFVNSSLITMRGELVGAIVVGVVSHSHMIKSCTFEMIDKLRSENPHLVAKLTTKVAGQIVKIMKNKKLEQGEQEIIDELVKNN